MTTNIDAIRSLLAEDIFRAKIADQDAEDFRDKLNDDYDPDRSAWRIAELHQRQGIASEARQRFSARTEMLQHIDLGDTTVDELIGAAIQQVSVLLGVDHVDWEHPSTGAVQPERGR